MDGSPPRHLQDEVSSAKTQKTPSNELANRLANLPVADAEISVENRWCQLRDTIQSTTLDILGRAHRQHQDWFDDNDAAINALLVEKNQLHKAYIDRPTAANKTAFYRSRRLVQQMDAWMTRKAEEIQGPFQHAHTVNAPSARESAWSDIFGRNARTIRQFQLPLQILPTLMRTL
ncbi:unnamed protein product, partial [Schistocephalus solidus]|uniref:Uncharacterized protein n=1 Tax=Schistocephalus solidus TaxID=70667 RepID=A0A183TUN4_SCHSO